MATFARFLILLLLCAPPLASASTGGLRFAVSFPPTKRVEPVTGRLVVYLVREGSSISERQPPSEGPFFDDPQPMFGIDVFQLAPEALVIVDDDAAAFPVKPSRLAPGTYRAQAVLDAHRLNGRWRREPGNLFSQIVTFTVDPAKPLTEPVALLLTDVTPVRTPRQAPGVEYVTIPSKLLSEFRGTPVSLTAGVVFPSNHDPQRQYPAIYVVPGFGGDHTMAAAESLIRQSPRFQDVPHQTLWRNAFVVVLDPEGPNGHHLFANSDNNGPVGDALVKELIPALDQKFNLAQGPSARLLTGHSSGGWSSVWLTLAYSETFGACWASAPDPVDFRAFQLSNLYESDNWYTDLPNAQATFSADGIVDGEVPSYREKGKVRMTVRQENAMEEVLGPGNTSGQQWDSWFAAFGPRDSRGNPAALFDPTTGAMDARIAEKYRRYDLGALLRAEPQKFAPLFHERVRLAVGSEDNYFLNEAVALLKSDLTAIPFQPLVATKGSITVVPGADHNSVQHSEAVRTWPTDMIEFLKAGGFIKD
jgi:hypothetical protein